VNLYISHDEKFEDSVNEEMVVYLLPFEHISQTWQIINVTDRPTESGLDHNLDRQLPFCDGR
jgi:hypothetical protein